MEGPQRVGLPAGSSDSEEQVRRSAFDFDDFELVDGDTTADAFSMIVAEPGRRPSIAQVELELMAKNLFQVAEMQAAIWSAGKLDVFLDGLFGRFDREHFIPAMKVPFRKGDPITVVSEDGQTTGIAVLGDSAAGDRWSAMLYSLSEDLRRLKGQEIFSSAISWSTARDGGVDTIVNFETIFGTVVEVL